MGHNPRPIHPFNPWADGRIKSPHQYSHRTLPAADVDAEKAGFIERLLERKKLRVDASGKRRVMSEESEKFFPADE